MFTNDEISNFLSVISIIISLFALFNTIKSSYNPKIKIEPLYNSNTIKINNFFEVLFDKLLNVEFQSIILTIILLFITIIYDNVHFYLRKRRISYGIQYCRINNYKIILWVRIHNASKYPISIYNIANKQKRFLYFIYPLNQIKFDNVFITLKHEQNDKVIDLDYDEFLQLPITIESFSCVEKYIVLQQSNSLLSPTRKIFQPKFIKLKVEFMTPTKNFTKNIKVYNGNKVYKNTNINVLFLKLKKIEEEQE